MKKEKELQTRNLLSLFWQIVRSSIYSYIYPLVVEFEAELGLLSPPEAAFEAASPF